MKKFIIPLILINCIFYFTSCGSKNTNTATSTTTDSITVDSLVIDLNVVYSANEDSSSANYLGLWKEECDSINRNYTMLTDYIYRFSFDNKDEFDLVKLLKWYNTSYATYIHNFDSICPKSGLPDVEKIDSMMFLLYDFIADEKCGSRFGESINASIYSAMLQYKTVMRYKHILRHDTAFANEIVAWLDFQNKFFEYAFTLNSLEYWGGNIQTSINSAMIIKTNEYRLADAKKICEIYQDAKSDTIAPYVATTKDLFIQTIKITTDKAYDPFFINDEIRLQSYNETHQELIAYQDELIASFEKWYDARLSMDKSKMQLYDWCQELYEKQTAIFIIKLATIISHSYYHEFN